MVRVKYILPNGADFPACMPVMGEHFDTIRPAATMIVAGLLDAKMKIEIEVPAHKPG